MPNPGLPKDETERRVSALNAALEKGYPPPERATNGQKSAIQAASDALGVNEQTLRTWLRQHRDKIDWSLYQDPSEIGAIPEPEQIEASILQDRIKALEAALKSSAKEEITRQAVREKIFELSEATPEPPKWLSPKRISSGCKGVPTIMLSDWHWGEVVKPGEIYGANEFNLDIANARAKRVVETATDLLFNHIANPEYDGLVLALGGDMVTGDIHEELSKTNDAPIMPSVLNLFDALTGVIEKFAQRFDKIFIPCVTGNHGRNTRKPQKKERNATNFDWLVYQMLARHFKDRPGIQFSIPDGPDCHYSIYGHRYLLTHGDQFRGGNGIAGVLMPIERGRHKKSTRDTALQRSWDTMIIGHFHQLIQLPHLVVNGSLKGYDEYAFSENFSYEEPAQGCWITHPEKGITFQMPIYLGDVEKPGAKDWVSWAA